MRRLVLVLAGLGLVAGGAFVVTRPDPAPNVAVGPTSIQTAHLPALTVPEPKVPEVAFTRSVMGPTSMSGSDALLDLCQGPVGIELGGEHPLLVAEHDYCGGSAWMWKLREGDVVRLDGPGVTADTYVVTSLSNGRRREARISDLPQGADVVLQTCVSETEIVLLGLVPYKRLQT